MDKINMNIESLRKKSEEIEFNKSKDIVFRLQSVLSRYGKKAVGISAPQIKIFKRVIYINFNGRKLTIINPVIVSKNKHVYVEVEGCLSLPGKHIDVKRYISIEVEYINHRGDYRIERFYSYLGRVVQHEIDHLDGKLIIDYVEEYCGNRK